MGSFDAGSLAARARAAMRDRVAAGLGLVIAFLVMFGVFAMFSTGAAAYEAKQLGNQDLVMFDHAWQLRYFDLELLRTTTSYTDAELAERDSLLALHESADRSFDSELEHARETVSADNALQLDEVRDTHERIHEMELEIIALVDSGRSAEAEALLLGDYKTVKNEFTTNLDAFFEIQDSNILARTDNVLSETLGARKIIFSVLAAIGLVLLYIARVNQRQKQTAKERDDERELVTSSQLRRTRINDGFEMALNERETLTTFTDVLKEELAPWNGELLIADSSTAHLHRALSTNSEGEPSCCVATPTDCPAIRRGETLTFADSNSYDACPNLKGRDLGGGTAVCVPLKVMGKSIGISHNISPSTPLPHELQLLEELVMLGGNRIGILRAFATTTKQATRDPLTGLLNRRSMEEQVAQLESEGRPYSVAFCDLDHFKTLNDTYGHATGDRALRRYSEVLKSSLRPTDLASRWGGEEFVVVLPDASTQDAVEMLERLRESLALALMTSDLPRFTFSAGAAEATTGFDAATMSADAALLEAKRTGRDRTTTIADLDPAATQTSP